MRSFKSINEQQILFINSLFGTSQVEPIMVDVMEKIDSIKYKIEVVVGEGGRFLNYRLHLPNGETTLWSSWEDESDIRKSFKMMSFN